jgi:hypothetical protein
LVTVHIKVVLVPAVTPVTVEVFEVFEVIDPAPERIVQRPLPGAGLFPAKVNVLVAHCA